MKFDVVLDSEASFIRNVYSSGEAVEAINYEASRVIEANRALSFVAFADDIDEGYEVLSVTVSIDAKVQEGGIARRWGTFDDLDGDDVTVTATDSSGSPIGSIAQDTGSGRFWRWSYDTTDGPAENQQITVTATDIHGATSSETFPLTVINEAPSFLQIIEQSKLSAMASAGIADAADPAVDQAFGTLAAVDGD